MKKTHDDNLTPDYQAAAELIYRSQHILITAGAGMGVDSGLPDFRGKEGFYQAYPRFKNASLNFTDVANPKFLFQNPEQFWWFYGQRFALYNNTSPHHGYRIIQSWLERKDGFIFTSNVDGHFQKAGVPRARVVECHGSIHFLQCAMNCDISLRRLDRLHFSIEVQQPKITGALPRCPTCGGFARPAIMMFNDMHWNGALTSQQIDRFEDWRYSLDEKQLVVIEIGAGQTIPRIRNQSEAMKAPIIRINTNPDDATVHDGISLPVSGLEALEGIQRELIRIDPGFAFHSE